MPEEGETMTPTKGKPKPTAGDRERARKIVSRICLLNDGHTPSGCGLDCELDEDELVEEAFAQALADERERTLREASKEMTYQESVSKLEELAKDIAVDSPNYPLTENRGETPKDQYSEGYQRGRVDERERCARVVSDRAERLRLSAKNDVEMWDETARQKVLKFVEELERLAKAIREGDAKPSTAKDLLKWDGKIDLREGDA